MKSNRGAPPVASSLEFPDRFAAAPHELAIDEAMEVGRMARPARGHRGHLSSGVSLHPRRPVMALSRLSENLAPRRVRVLDPWITSPLVQSFAARRWLFRPSQAGVRKDAIGLLSSSRAEGRSALIRPVYARARRARAERLRGYEAHAEAQEMDVDASARRRDHGT